MIPLEAPESKDSLTHEKPQQTLRLIFVCLFVCTNRFAIPAAFANTVRLCGRGPCGTLCRCLHYLRVCHVFQVFGEQAQPGLAIWRHLSTVYLRRPGEITRVKLRT